MKEYRIKVTLLSDTVFGSGKALPGVVDADVLQDENGFPYMKGKTLKGKIREEYEHLCQCRAAQRGTALAEDLESLNRLFGEPDSSIDGKIYVSNLMPDAQLRAFFIRMMKNDSGSVGSEANNVTKKFPGESTSESAKESLSSSNGATGIALGSEDILNAMTSIQSFTAIDDTTGIAKEGSLRRIRVINKDQIFYSTISVTDELSTHDEALLGAAVASLRHLGTMETRGKGWVECRLLDGTEDITEACVRKLKEV